MKVGTSTQANPAKPLMTISYELQIWDAIEGDPYGLRHINDALGIPNRILKFSDKRTALLMFEELDKATDQLCQKYGYPNPEDPETIEIIKEGVIEHMVLMEYGANEEFPDDGNVIAEW